jgi:hypothetical protein
MLLNYIDMMYYLLIIILIVCGLPLTSFIYLTLCCCILIVLCFKGLPNYETNTLYYFLTLKFVNCLTKYLIDAKVTIHEG